MLQFKVLKHKTLPDTFGVMNDADEEIYQCATPDLFRYTGTMDDLRSLYRYTTVAGQLDDYELVTVYMYLPTDDKYKYLEQGLPPVPPPDPVDFYNLP